MSKMKQVFEALQDADNIAIQHALKFEPPPLPRELHLLMRDGKPVAVYMHKRVADYDEWLCNQADDGAHTVVGVPFYSDEEVDQWLD